MGANVLKISFIERVKLALVIHVLQNNYVELGNLHCCLVEDGY